MLPQDDQLFLFFGLQAPGSPQELLRSNPKGGRHPESRMFIENAFRVAIVWLHDKGDLVDRWKSRARSRSDPYRAPSEAATADYQHRVLPFERNPQLLITDPPDLANGWLAGAQQLLKKLPDQSSPRSNICTMPSRHAGVKLLRIRIDPIVAVARQAARAKALAH